ncbi:MAG: methionyl-tRNA formyltransferase [Solirubrobacteraceae bacterium]|jgi:methionyl-tRNA formyltransferase|nr:methionyl-tRNA formyltransferase [Solirubrobacteraceae bacterium]
MRIVVNGQQAFGAEVLKALVARGEDVVAVLCAPDREGRPPDPLKEAAEEAGIPVRQPESFEGRGAAADLAELRPDLMVMAFVTLFVPEPVLNTPTHGSIQYHPSLLPRHRGPSAINWAIIQGDRTTGLSIFWPDEGLDTGPVLLTKEVAIEDDDTLGSLYFDKLFPLGVEAMVESVDLVREGRAPRIVQDDAHATYESWCRKEDAEVDWSRPVREVYDLIRGTNPRPGAWTTHDGDEIGVLAVELRGGEDDRGGAPGEVLAIDGDRIVVAAGGGALAIRGVRAGGDKLDAAAFAERTGLRPGALLGGGDRSAA